MYGRLPRKAAGFAVVVDAEDDAAGPEEGSGALSFGAWSHRQDVRRRFGTSTTVRCRVEGEGRRSYTVIDVDLRGLFWKVVRHGRR